VDLTRTRTSLHGIAELLLAGPQYAESGTIRLRIVPGGIATVASPDLRVEGSELVAESGRRPLAGTYSQLAASVGVTAQAPDSYHDHADVGADDRVDVEPAALTVLMDALAVGDAALRAFAPQETPVLWPEHLDVAISLDEVNFGVSPGDASSAEPYAYVGPWTPRTGDFWNQPFGAAQPLSALGGPDAVAAFFREGARLAAG